MNNFKQEIKEYVEERGWDLLDHPANIAKSISIESAELLEIFQWHNYSPEEIKKDPELFQKTKDELADVLIYATELAVALDIDMEQAFRDKFEKVKKKYPADQVRGNDENYYSIKQAHRA